MCLRGQCGDQQLWRNAGWQGKVCEHPRVDQTVLHGVSWLFHVCHVFRVNLLSSLCEENRPPNANWHTAVSTGPTNGAFMLSVLSLLHGCVWQNWHQCTIMLVFNHRLNDGSVKQLRDRQIAQRDMLQQFQKYETSLPISVLMWWCCVSGDTYLSGEYCSCLLHLNGEQK